MRERDVIAAPCAVPQRGDADSRGREALVGERDHQVAERSALGLHVAHRDAVEGIERGLERRHREHLRRRAQHRADAVGAPEVIAERERRRMREPAGERLIQAARCRSAT